METDILASQNLADFQAGEASWDRILQAGVPVDLVQILQKQFADASPRLSDPDMALRNLSTFFVSARNPLSSAALFERDLEALPNLLQLLSTSQFLSELLVRDHECYDLLRMSEGQPVSRETLIEEIVDEVDTLTDAEDVSATLRRFKLRETMRIAYGDIVRNQPVSVVAKQISILADAIIHAAIRFLRRKLDEKLGQPRCRNGEVAKFCVLALGKLGGSELNYSSDIDLVFFYEEDGKTDQRRAITNREYFERLSRDIIKLLSESTAQGTAYRVDMRLRPDGSRGAICMPKDSMIAYYDTKGRTWERQAFVKARAAAGDEDLGNELLDLLQPWIYRRYLSLADISGIKSLKRRIEHRTITKGTEERNIKTGHGGIRDIEFVIQFLQLLNGGTLAEVQTGNTLEAIRRLERVGCLNPKERLLLEENYDFLRKLEHRLQILLDLQTHTLPSDERELRKVAMRMGFQDDPNGITALEAFRSDLSSRTEVNRRILDHLMHDAFDGDSESEPEVDLVNDPDPAPERITEVLSRYPFDNIPSAYENLMSLATEKIRFLSTRRCRHFLASIAPRLLAAIAEIPEPDSTLINLSRVSDSIGGKAALWELFSNNRASLNLYVTLCAACPYLSGLLTSNPGMIDELMDSLLVDRLPTLDILESALEELSSGAEDIQPILHSFKHAQHLRVGVRDILGKDDIRDTHCALSDTAESCLKLVANREYDKLVEKFGVPTIGALPDPILDEDSWLVDRIGEPCSPVILALGKLGGREPNYHSDLDLVFLYESDGRTVPQGRTSSDQATTNNHFFGELGQRIIKAVNSMGPQGRLYEIDARLRPSGRSGTLAVPFSKFCEYFAAGAGQLWERQALCKARPIYGSAEAIDRAMQAVRSVVINPPWNSSDAEEIRTMRYRLEESASENNLKRGLGGTVDTEFIVQMLQLRHGAKDPTVMVSGTFDALVKLALAGYLSEEDANFLSGSYRLLRNVEARIRLMNLSGRHEFPTDEKELRKLAFLMGYASAEKLEQEVRSVQSETRKRFEEIFNRSIHN